MLWTWDPNKDAENVHKHRISFETAQQVFNDHHFITRPDDYPCEERYQTIGSIGNSVIIVVYTWPQRSEPGRIITARRATRAERRIYEEGQL